MSALPLTHWSPPRAEREGFEPSRELTPPTRLAGECLQPLGHLSGGGEISLGQTDFSARCEIPPAVPSAKSALVGPFVGPNDPSEGAFSDSPANRVRRQISAWSATCRWTTWA